MAYPMNTTSNDNGFPFVNPVNSKHTIQWSNLVDVGIIPVKAPAIQLPMPAPMTVWLLACRSILSFAIVCTNFSAELQVELSLDGGTTFLQAYTFPLSGEGIIDSVSDFPLCATAGRFTLLALAGTTSSGWLETRAF